ncbi:MAG: hypothetical protein JNM93_10790 [Bacteriovoracaceae bacterium]|nr:hypothetical protein [Bacteriovoracaceae bacterium]
MKLFLLSFLILGHAHALNFSNVEQINLKCENGMYFDFEKANSIEIKDDHGALNGLNVAKSTTANIKIEEENINIEILSKGVVLAEFQPAIQKTECFHDICSDENHTVRSFSFKFSVNKNTTTCYIYLFE